MFSRILQDSLVRQLQELAEGRAKQHRVFYLVGSSVTADVRMDVDAHKTGPVSFIC